MQLIALYILNLFSFTSTIRKMKKDTHPEYFPKAKVTCSCGNTFELGTTVPELKVEICSNCHPVFTGKMKLVDTAGRLDRFKAKLEKAEKVKESRVKK